MKMKNSAKKGYVYTIEAGIAISVIVIAVVLVLNSQQAAQPLSVPLIKQQAYEALEYLDNKGDLKLLIYSEDADEIENRLRALLPPTISIDADVCMTECSGTLPAGQTVISVDYYISGYRDNFGFKKLRVWMWGKF